ncbi:MAG: dihydroneopterin aldolase [Oscillospiraceae bacterium]|nr:dihydroneopterin aldolase [Oscillospiraceae bacterium]
MDAIYIKDLRVYAHHGVKEEEKRKGQPFILDITLRTDLARAGETDDIADTVNYAAVTRCVIETMQSGSDNLIERAAARVADAVLAQFPVNEVTVLLKKPRAPVAADFDYMAVEITRGRGAEKMEAHHE